jgi:hypothetical protein
MFLFGRRDACAMSDRGQLRQIGPKLLPCVIPTLHKSGRKFVDLVLTLWANFRSGQCGQIGGPCTVKKVGVKSCVFR